MIVDRHMHILPAGAPGRVSAIAGHPMRFRDRIDLILDYLWGHSATTILLALAKTVENKPVRFVHLGGASRKANIELSGTVLRSAALTLLGSGVGSVGRKGLVDSISKVFEAVGPAGLKIATHDVPLSNVEQVWERASGKPRVVFTI